MGTNKFFYFFKKGFFPKYFIWTFLTVFLIGGVLFFFPGIFATQLTLDADSITQEKIERIFAELKSGNLSGTLSTEAPNFTNALVGAILARVVGENTSPDSVKFQENVKSFLASPDQQEDLIAGFVNAALDETGAYFEQFGNQNITLKTTPNRDKETIISYLRDLEKILNGNFDGFILGDLVTELDRAIAEDDASIFIDASSRLQKTYTALTVLEVPQVFAEFHQRELSLLNQSWAMFDALAGFRPDLLKSAAALSYYQTLLDKKTKLEGDLGQLISELDRELTKN